LLLTICNLCAAFASRKIVFMHVHKWSTTHMSAEQMTATTPVRTRSALAFGRLCKRETLTVALQGQALYALTEVAERAEKMKYMPRLG
jgi:hypothetical protein